MLYVNSRNKSESFTAFRVLAENPVSGKGVIVPFRLRKMTDEQIQNICSGSFYDAVAQMLNHLFNLHLEGWDLELNAGRNATAIYQMNPRIHVSELWHNPADTYAFLEKALYKKLGQTGDNMPLWASVGIRIAVLFGIYAQLNGQGFEFLDVVGVSNDSTTYLAPFYAKLLGLPIRNIIIGCDEESGLWELIHKGQLPAFSTAADAVEMMIFSVLGEEEVARFWEQHGQKRPYILDEEQICVFSEGLFAAVIGDSRLDSVIENVYRTNAYRMSRQTAVAYSAVQDYRAKTGDCRDVLIFADGKSK